MDIENVEITMRELNAINSAMKELRHESQEGNLLEGLYKIGGSFKFHVPEELYLRPVAGSIPLYGRIYIKTDNAGCTSVAVSLPKRKT